MNDMLLLEISSMESYETVSVQRISELQLLQEHVLQLEEGLIQSVKDSIFAWCVKTATTLNKTAKVIGLTHAIEVTGGYLKQARDKEGSSIILAIKIVKSALKMSVTKMFRLDQINWANMDKETKEKEMKIAKDYLGGSFLAMPVIAVTLSALKSGALIGILTGNITVSLGLFAAIVAAVLITIYAFYRLFKQAKRTGAIRKETFARELKKYDESGAKKIASLIKKL